MIGDFQSNDTYTLDIGAKSVSAWFSKTDVQTMRKVLDSEAPAIDGVRLYFGAVSKNGTQFKIKILLIPTKLKNLAPIPPDPKSIHGDYGLGSPLLTTELGSTLDHKASEVFQAGGLLYGDGPPPMGTGCTNTSLHRITNHDTYTWVQKRDDKEDLRVPAIRSCDQSGYNTESEWFDICFISSLFDAVLDDNNNLDGLRIYLGEGFKLKYNKDRDVFIFVPTHTNGINHDDDFSCIKLLPSSLCVFPNDNPLHKTKEYEIRDFNHRYFAPNHTYMEGGYDKGELCPNTCN